MRKWRIQSSGLIVSHLSSLVLCAAALGLTALAMQAQAPSPSASGPSLQTYTAPDQSAQAGVPPGWKVSKGAETVIIMDGPSGEEIALGTTFVVRNAPFQLGQKPANGVDLSMPNSASLAQKFTMMEQWGASLSNAADPQVRVASSTPIPVLGGKIPCGRMSGTFNSLKGPVTFGLLICSLPVDVGGTYKVMMKIAQAPPNVAAQEKALAGAVFASYKIPASMLQKKIAPHIAPPPAPAMSMGSAPAAPGSIGNSPDTSGCFDLVVIRETPERLLPPQCRN